MPGEPLIYSVTDFVAVFNQTINTTYPYVVIEGELSNFRVSKGRWVYFDLKDEASQIKFFGTVYQLTAPLEDGMLLRVSGTPQLHPNFGFSITIQSIALAGEGSIKKASKLLELKLEKEGLFSLERKRQPNYPPAHIGLIASKESAAYSDFLKIIQARWPGIVIDHFDVQVQGDQAPNQIVEAIQYFNGHNQPPEVLVITRGGGSADDLQAFNSEPVVRAIAASRISTVVAIGHERDISLAERAADVHASTPSNAAELLVPDRQEQQLQLNELKHALNQRLRDVARLHAHYLQTIAQDIHQQLIHRLSREGQYLKQLSETLEQINPQRVLRRGYVVVRANGKTLRRAQQVVPGQNVDLEFYDGTVQAKVQ